MQHIAICIGLVFVFLQVKDKDIRLEEFGVNDIWIIQYVVNIATKPQKKVVTGVQQLVVVKIRVVSVMYVSVIGGFDDGKRECF